MDGCGQCSLASGPGLRSGTTLAAGRVLTGPASQNILFWAASIGHPARSSLTRPATRRFKVRPGHNRPPCPYQGARLSAEELNSPGGLHFPFIRRRRDFARGAIFYNYGRMKIESRRCIHAPSNRSRSGGILAEGSPQGRIRPGREAHPGY